MNTLPLLVISAAILAFFQDEFASLFHKLFSRAWVRILLPLTLASVGVQTYTTMRWMLEIMQTRIHAMMLAFFKLFPYGYFFAIYRKVYFCFLFLVCLYGACFGG